MREQETNISRFDRFGRERYMLIHKHPVGPKTAERLFLLYEELSKSQQPQEMYRAGWAAAEASMVGGMLPAGERVQLAKAASECWEFALQLERERAAHNAWRKSTHPSTTGEYRIATTLASAPIFEALPQGRPPKQLLLDTHERLVSIAESNVTDMRMYRQQGWEGRYSNHRGFGYEQISQLAISRLLTSRLIATTSMARADSGAYYPWQTHDLQIISLDRETITRITPAEVKTRLRPAYFQRYDAALIGGRRLIGDNDNAVHQTVSLFRQELNGEISAEGLDYLDGLTDEVIHAIRHYHRAEEFGRHCVNASRCQLPVKRHASSISA